MSELQNELDRGEISPKDFFDAWDEQMEEKERLHPGFQNRLYEYLMGQYPGPGVAAMSSFVSKAVAKVLLYLTPVPVDLFPRHRSGRPVE